MIAARHGKDLSSRRQLDHVFSGRMAEFDNVLVPQFHISAFGYGFIVDLCPVRTLQVNHIRLHFANFIAKLVPALNIPELYDSMLF